MEHYTKTIAPPPDEASIRLPNRSALQSLIEQSGLDPDDRRILAAILDLHWDPRWGPEHKPTEPCVRVNVTQLGKLTGICRKYARDRLRALSRLGFFRLDEYSHRPADVWPNWGKLVGMEASTVLEASTKLVEASIESVEASTILEGFTEGVEASIESVDASASDTDRIIEAVRQGSNHVAETIRQTGNHQTQAITDAITHAVEARLGRLEDLVRQILAGLDSMKSMKSMEASMKSMEASTPLSSIEFNSKNESLDSIELNLKAEASKTVQASTKVVEASTEVDWPNPWRQVDREELTDNDRLEAIFRDAVANAKWLPGDAGRRELFALAEYSLKIPGQGATAAFIAGIKRRLFGPRRRADDKALNRADNRLRTRHNHVQETPGRPTELTLPPARASPMDRQALLEATRAERVRLQASASRTGPEPAALGQVLDRVCSDNRQPRTEN